MAKKKILIGEVVLNSFSKNKLIDDISLEFTIKDDFTSFNINLKQFDNGKIERRKFLKKFKDFIQNTNKSIKSKKTMFKSFSNMLKIVGQEISDEKSYINAINMFSKELYKKVNSRIIKEASYNSYKSQIRVIFNECYGIDNKEILRAFPENIVRSGKIHNATILDNKGNERSFSNQDFKNINKIALSFYKFLEEKEEGFSGNFIYKDIYNNKIKILKGNRNKNSFSNKKIFCLLVSFICLTGINLTPITKMRRSDLKIDKVNNLVSFSVICNRKNKEQFHNLPLRDSQIIYFEKLIKESEKISPKIDILFPFKGEDAEITYFGEGIQHFYDFFNKGFIGEYSSLKINSRKLRHSFGLQFEDIDLRSMALFNSQRTAAKHYSTGDSKETNNILQNAMNIYTIALSNNENIQVVKENIEKIKVINIEDIKTLKKENSQITSSGIFCIDSNDGVEANKFKKKISNIKLKDLNEVHCANILACFNCKNSILVNNFENVYLLKSFYNYLNEIIYSSDTSSLFSDKNAVKSALSSISIILENKIDKKIISKVNKHIEKNGNHILWNINEGII